jgi:hypothetical protein
MPLLKRHIRFIFISTILFFILSTSATAQSQDETKKVLAIVQEFFDAIEKHDTIAFNSVFLSKAHMFISRPVGDSIQYISKPAVGRSTLKPGTAYKEIMRDKGVKVEVHQNIAMAWVPYNFYVNNTFSHCGVDAFTFLKTKQGWKIALLAYTVENKGCEEW